MLNIKRSIGDNIINHIILNIFLIYIYITPYLRVLNNSLGGNNLTYEDGQYYIQNGDDVSTKKALGSATLPLIGLSYEGGYGQMIFSVSKIRNMKKFIVKPNCNSVRYATFNNLKSVPSYANSQTMKNGAETDIKSICESSSNTYLLIATNATLYGTEQPFDVYI